MNNNIKLLAEKLAHLKSLKTPKDTFESLEEWLKVELTYSSNAIEGNTLTRVETAEVIERGVTAIISGKSLQDQLEAINHARALESVKELVKKRKSHQFIVEEDIKAVHKIILSGIDDRWAGIYRQEQVRIAGSSVVLPSPHKLSKLMKEFIEWIMQQQNHNPVLVAANAHYKFVTIHPFRDGNGRTARLLMNLILVLNGYPMAVIKNEERTEYINSLEMAHTTGDLQAFYEVVITAVDRSLDTYIKVARGESDALSPITGSSEQAKDENIPLMRIGDLARESQESVHTLRFWIKEGLIDAASETSAGYQLFKPSMIKRVQDIRKLQREKRLRLPEIKRELGLI